MVSFNQINPFWKVPGVSVELDPSLAGTPTNPKFGVIAGYRLAAGTVPANTLIAVGTQSDADTMFGRGSMLARMFKAWFALNRSTPLFALTLDAPGAGVQASGTITVSSPPTAAGTLYLYIAGQKVTVAIGATDTSNAVAASINAAINAALDLPATSAVATNVATLTARHKGTVGNDIRMEDSYLGPLGGEVLPAGLALTYSGSNFLAGGTGVPDWTNAITQLGDGPYKFFASGLNDSGSFSTLNLEYGFTDSGRWGWLRQAYGQAFSFKRDTYSNLITYGPTENYAVVHAMAIEPEVPSPGWEWAAAWTAREAAARTADAARPTQTLTLDGILPAPRTKRFNKSQLHALASVGLAIQGTEIDGQSGNVPMILREQSRYQKNTVGVADNAYELASTLATLDEIYTRRRQRLTSKYPRHKLANDGTRFAPGQAIMTPNIMKGELIAHYREMEFDGLVENVQAFIDNLIVVRSSVNPDALEIIDPPDLINGLRRVNIKAQFRLQFPLAA